MVKKNKVAGYDSMRPLVGMRVYYFRLSLVEPAVNYVNGQIVGRAAINLYA